MARTQRNFIAGRMNKSLDERLIPNGEYEDALNVLILNVNHIESFVYILEETEYWGSKEEMPAVEEITGEDDNIKRAMLQWATERSL